jgi:signal transduction histidine kinase
MNSLGRGTGQLKVLLRTPEMRAFWFSLPVTAVLIAGSFFYMPLALFFVAVFLLLALQGIVAWSSLRTAQANLDSSIERNELKSIVYGLNDALLVYDQNFRIVFFNPSAESLFGISAKEAMGRIMKPQDVEDPRSRLLAQIIFPSLAPSLVSRSKSGQYPQISDLSFDDPVLELRVTTSPISDNNGHLLGFMKLIRNRTREVGLLKSKEEFVTVASHQLRTPITELNWALEALTKDTSVTGDAKMITDRAHISARQLLELVEDLLSVSKIEEGRFGYQFEQTDLVEFVEKRLARAMPHAQSASLKLYLDRPKDPLPPVMLDPVKLDMVVSNLIDNAIRYNVPNGQIVVSVRKADEGPYLTVSVKDTGIGIPSEEMPHIFTKFYRSSNALKFQTEGSGLGLYIAKNIVAAHGGRMWAETELSRGSMFSFALPTDFGLIPQKEVALE